MHMYNVPYMYMYTMVQILAARVQQEYSNLNIHAIRSTLSAIVHTCTSITVYFRISLKRGQTHSGEFERGQIQIQGGGGGDGQSHINKHWEKPTAKEAESTPLPPPPQIN